MVKIWKNTPNEVQALKFLCVYCTVSKCNWVTLMNNIKIKLWFYWSSGCSVFAHDLIGWLLHSKQSTHMKAVGKYEPHKSLNILKKKNQPTKRKFLYIFLTNLRNYCFSSKYLPMVFITMMNDWCKIISIKDVHKMPWSRYELLSNY